MSLSGPITVGIVPIPRRSYISVGTLHTDIFKYTTAMNSSYVMVGTLTTLDALGTGTASNCPVNRVLRENGRTLTPEANPVSTLVKSSAAGGTVALTLNALLVGVYDSVSGLNGFIDPNSAKFQLYNGSRTNYLPDSVNPVSLAKDSLVRSATVVALTPVTVTNTAVTFDANAAQTFTLTPNSTSGSAIFNTRITVTAVPAAGSFITLIITVPTTNIDATAFAATFATTVQFGTGSAGVNSLPSGLIRETGVVTLSAAAAGDIFVVNFVSTGAFLVETSRSTPAAVAADTLVAGNT